MLITCHDGVAKPQRLLNKICFRIFNLFLKFKIFKFFVVVSSNYSIGWQYCSRFLPKFGSSKRDN